MLVLVQNECRLACESIESGRALAAQDPYLSDGVYTPRFLEWKLVGINPDAIDPELLVRPADIGPPDSGTPDDD